MQISNSHLFRYPFNVVALLIVIIATSTLEACNNDVSDDLKPSISTFISHYFPLEEVGTYTENPDGTYTVVIKDGAELQFNADQEWTSVNGRGSTLPENLIENECPDPLVRYILEMEFMDQVYLLSRDSLEYHVEFLDTYIDYTIADGKIIYPEAHD